MSSVMSLRAQLRRRILVSYAVDADAARRVVPVPFRPQLVDGQAVAGVCVIGLREVRPGWVRPPIGVRTENAAHRIAVEWDEAGHTRRGVYIFQRHSASLVPVLAGGRIFPGVQKHARFLLDESATRFAITMDAADARLHADVEISDTWSSELFPTLDTASEFYREGSIGWSPRRDGHGAEPLELSTPAWAAEGVQIHEIRSSVMDDLFAGAARLDSAIVMRDIPLTWDAPRPMVDSRSAVLTP